MYLLKQFEQKGSRPSVFGSVAFDPVLPLQSGWV